MLEMNISTTVPTSGITVTNSTGAHFHDGIPKEEKGFCSYPAYGILNRHYGFYCGPIFYFESVPSVLSTVIVTVPPHQ